MNLHVAAELGAALSRSMSGVEFLGLLGVLFVGMALATRFQRWLED